MLCTKKISTYGISTSIWALKSTCHSTWRPLRPLKVGEFMKLQDCRLMNLLTSIRQHHHISSLAYPPLSLSLCLFSLLCQEKSISRHFPRHHPRSSNNPPLPFMFAFRTSPSCMSCIKWSAAILLHHHCIISPCHLSRRIYFLSILASPPVLSLH